MQKPNNKDGSEDNKMQCRAVEEQSLHCLPSYSNFRKQWMNFIFKEVPDCVSENLFLSSLHFTVDLQTRHNSTVFSLKINTKRRCCADSIGSDPTVMSHHTNVSNCLILWGHYCFVSYYTSLDMYWIFVHFLPKLQHRLSMKDVGCQT